MFCSIFFVYLKWNAIVFSCCCCSCLCCLSTSHPLQTCNTTYWTDSSPWVVLDLETNTQHAADHLMFMPAEHSEAIEEATENKMRWKETSFLAYIHQVRKNQNLCSQRWELQGGSHLVGSSPSGKTQTVSQKLEPIVGEISHTNAASVL